LECVSEREDSGCQGGARRTPALAFAQHKVIFGKQVKRRHNFRAFGIGVVVALSLARDLLYV
jgi:hypothetical protein